jgi:ATP-dependent RNA helicase DHX37/DHR1
LLEKNYQSFGKIAITQPRRLATIALANRVAQETHTKLGQTVGYQVRHDRKDSAETLIKYLTDGILLNEMSSDSLLTSYSVIVIDEAHERKVNTDILIGLLSRLVLTRYKMSLENKCHPLRLVIMSATMRVQDFQNELLFDFKVPIINVEARMFPVTTYFEKNTPEDYKAAAVKKCLTIHRKLPDGDVLVFMTGK